MAKAALLREIEDRPKYKVRGSSAFISLAFSISLDCMSTRLNMLLVSKVCCIDDSE